jgi:hypothetical protein
MKKTILSIIPALFCVMLFGQESANLRLSLEKNKVYKFRATSEQTIVQSINGNQQTIESESTYYISLKMIDATPAFIVTEIRIDSLSTKTNAMGNSDNMSSTLEGNIASEKTSEIMSYFMNRMTKNPIYAKLDFTGKVNEIVNTRMLSDVILIDTSAITLSEPSASAVKTQIVNMVSDNAFKTIVEMFTFCLPGKSIASGESWSLPTSINSGGMFLDINTTYKLDGISGNKAGVTAESNIKAAANAVPMESGGAKITYDDLKGLSKAEISIDINTGLVIENTSKTHLAGTLGVAVAGMNMQIPMDITSDSKILSLQ